MNIDSETFDFENDCPLITIGIPTYNGGNAVVKAIASVMQQRYPNVNILISDNASTDDTPAICHNLVKKYPTVNYFRQTTNLGMLGNFEFLLQHASGKYFMWLADDDTLARNALRHYVHFLESNPGYSLVSGIISYRTNGKVTEFEKRFTFSSSFRALRVIQYYFKVRHGAMYHGMMRTELGKQIAIRRVIGNDWHFVANLAFLGKIKNLKSIGYNKTFGGSSRSFQHYVKIIGENSFAAKYPHLKIAIDAYREVMFRSAPYQTLSKVERLTLGTLAFLAVGASHFIKIYPFILAGKIKRGVKFVFNKAATLSSRTGNVIKAEID